MAVNRPILAAQWLGRVPYVAALEVQRKLVDERKSNGVQDTLLLLEHDHVFTLGRRAAETHLLSERLSLLAAGIEVEDTDRGGEATYHGPGQLVAYPIVGIRDLKIGPVAYVRILEEATIDLLRDYGIAGHRVVGKTGVWVGGEPGERPKEGENPAGRKIAAIGVRITNGVAMHGIAINVTTDLSYYGHIVPCGMPGLDVTSIMREGAGMQEVKSIGSAWAQIFTDMLFFELDWRRSPVVFEPQSETSTVSV